MTKPIMIVVASLLLFSMVSANLGVDLSVPTNTSTWQCIQDEGGVSFGIVRVYRSVGEVDENAPASIQSAFDAGIKDLSGYIFPCIGSSTYSQDNNITCDAPEAQMKNTIAFLEVSGINVRRHRDNSLAETIPPTTIPSVPGKPTLNVIYLDIEDEVPSKYFDSNPAVNQQFIRAMVDEAEKLGVEVGFYTTTTYWENIMDNTDAYSSYRLWYPRWDDENSMDFFEPFSGWETVAIKQTAGDAPLCGISQVDLDYKENIRMQ